MNFFSRKNKLKTSRCESEYKELGQFIWTNYVPKSGQSNCVQGELLRASEKLRDEAHRNGNGNWDAGHEILALYIRNTLCGQNDVPKNSKAILRSDIKRILRYEEPYLEDDLFDRVVRIILDWCFLHEESVPRDINPDLYR